MGKTIHLSKGYDIKLVGNAQSTISQLPISDIIASSPSDFRNIIPKLMVQQGDEVLAGQALFFDKNQPEAVFTAPVSGEIVEVVRGDKRRILEVRILPDKEIKYVEFTKANPAHLSREAIVKQLTDSGCWNYIRQRPYSLIANPAEQPKAIFVSCFDSAPLAPDLSFVIGLEKESFQAGLSALKVLANGNLHVSVREEQTTDWQNGLSAEHVHRFKGPHPAGNVGIQIHHIAPIQKGEFIWYVNPQDVIIIGRLFREGRYRAERVVALTGSCVNDPQYVKVLTGQSIKSITDGRLQTGDNRIIQGNVLTGQPSAEADFLSFYTNQLTIIPEGKEPEFLGWLLPGLQKLSLSRTFVSWLFPNRSYSANTNTHGEERAFVMTGQYDKVLPMNILPVYLLKAILAKDVERMEELGIYEISEEDFALCEFVCTSKINVQQIVSEGLELMRAEG